MPWKNGQGQSQEIAIDPSGASFTHFSFNWRLSSAEIFNDGNFSQFSGYNRHLTIVEGGPLTLHIPSAIGKTVKVLHVAELLSFKGDASIVYQVGLDGAPAQSGRPQVTDLNLIYKADQVTARMATFKLQKKPRSFLLDGKTFFIYAIQGKIKIETFPGEIKIDLLAGDTLQINHSENITVDAPLILLEPASSACIVALIELA
jgi:environmental stress-induced protein Ves